MTHRPVVLAIDPGFTKASKTGWAVYLNECIVSGVQCYEGPEYGCLGHKLADFYSWLTGFVCAGPPIEQLTYEQPTFQNHRSAEVQLGQIAIIHLVSAQRILPVPVSVHPLTLKKWATGSGRADKEDMIKAANRLAGQFPPFCGPPIPITDHNQADAVCLLACVLQLDLLH